MKIGSHLYVAAMVLPGIHNHEEVQVASSIRTRYNAASQSQLIVGEVEVLSNQAFVPRQLRQPHRPSTIEMQEHRLTHTAYRSWCPICVKAKGQPNDNRKGVRKGAITDTIGLRLVAYIKSTTGNNVNTGIETIGSSSWRTALEDQFFKDNELAILSFAQAAAKELTIPWRRSAPYEHQSQGATERFHKTLLAQVPIRFDLVYRCSLGQPDFDGLTNYQRRWGVKYNAAICNFVEMVLADVKHITNQKLAIRNQEQKVEGMWLGKTTNNGEHIIALKNTGGSIYYKSDEKPFTDDPGSAMEQGAVQYD
eukprot:832920-Amphidinium_carterae.2